MTGAGRLQRQQRPAEAAGGRHGDERTVWYRIERLLGRTDHAVGVAGARVEVVKQ